MDENSKFSPYFCQEIFELSTNSGNVKNRTRIIAESGGNSQFGMDCKAKTVARNGNQLGPLAALWRQTQAARKQYRTFLFTARPQWQNKSHSSHKSANVRKCHKTKCLALDTFLPILLRSEKGHILNPLYHISWDTRCMKFTISQWTEKIRYAETHIDANLECKGILKQREIFFSHEM